MNVIHFEWEAENMNVMDWLPTGVCTAGQGTNTDSLCSQALQLLIFSIARPPSFFGKESHRLNSPLG